MKVDGSGGTDGSDVADRASAFVRKKRAAELREKLGHDCMLYEAIRGANIRSTRATNMLGGEPMFSPAQDGMIEIGDGRLISGGLKMSFTNRGIISTSFNPDWTCIRCEHHSTRPALQLRGDTGLAVRQVFILSDQNFPAVLPVTSSQQCLNILRVENASLSDLVDEFNAQIGNRRVMPGSVILLFSAAHLANVGISAYIEDHVKLGESIINKHGKEVKVGLLPPLLLAGCPHSSTCREIFELLAWAKTYYDQSDVYLEKSFETAKEILLETGIGQQQYLEVKRMRLPAHHSSAATTLWHSGGNADGVNNTLPKAIKPTNEAKEERLVITMLEELRSNLALDLDTNPAFERGLGPQSRVKQAVDFLIVGSSNASKLIKPLGEMGYTSHLIYMPNWRISGDSVSSLARKLTEAVADVDPDVVVLQLLDNSCFYGRTRDGSRTASKKAADGKYCITWRGMSQCAPTTLSWSTTRHSAASWTPWGRRSASSSRRFRTMLLQGAAWI
jgi:hypothetical protein